MASAREQYENLKLKTLDLVSIQDVQWNILGRGVRNPQDNVFRNALPIIVAEFKEAAANEIMEWARKQSTNVPMAQLPILADCASDLLLIDQAVFGPNRGYFQSDIGLFESPKTPQIHDDKLWDNGRIYLGRLNTLPVQYIRRAEIETLPADQQQRVEHLIVQARKIRPGSPHGYAEKEELIAMGVIKELPLKAIGLMISGDRCGTSNPGTLHSSTDLPFLNDIVQPVHSAMFRGVMYPKIMSPK